MEMEHFGNNFIFSHIAQKKLARSAAHIILGQRTVTGMHNANSVIWGNHVEYPKAATGMHKSHKLIFLTFKKRNCGHCANRKIWCGSSRVPPDKFGHQPKKTH